MTRQKSTGCDLACAPRDSVDALLQSWAERRPDLDFRPVGVITRLARVRAHLDAELEEVFAGSGLPAQHPSRADQPGTGAVRTRRPRPSRQRAAAPRRAHRARAASPR